MNEAAKATISDKVQHLGDQDLIDFDFGTTIGEAAAAKAIVEFIYEDPEQVADRPAIAESPTSPL